MKRNYLKVASSTLLMISLALPVFAQEQIPLELSTIINRIKTTIQGLGFIVAVLFIIWGGFQFMTAGGSEEKVAGARRLIMWAMVGLAVIVLAELLARTACWVATGNFSCPSAVGG